MKEVNKENEFERLLKEKADRFDLKPAPEVWQQVQDAIQKDRRRRFAWWLMAALLFAVMGTGAFFMLEKKSYPPATPPTAENNSEQGTHTEGNSASETSSTKKNPQPTSIGDNSSLPQNQSADNTLSKNHDEKISVGKNERESRSLPSASESAENSQMLSQVQHNDTDRNGFIASLSLKPFMLSLPEVSPDVVLLPMNPPDQELLPASHGNSFYVEADAMPLASFVRNHASPTPVYNPPLSAVPVYNSSYSFIKGYSAGGNLFFQRNNKWLFGAGAHLTRTHLEALTDEQTVPQYDTTGTAYDTSGFLVNTYDTVMVTATESQHAINQWLEISFMAGVRLFPDSKNHLRILAGLGYSRLLSSELSEQHSRSFDATVNAGLNPSTVAGNAFPSYQKNQLQLFSEIAYQRDLTSQLSFSGGIQLHYYPMNLLNSNELSQHMMWLGLKAGLLLRI